MVIARDRKPGTQNRVSICVATSAFLLWRNYLFHLKSQWDVMVRGLGWGFVGPNSSPRWDMEVSGWPLPIILSYPDLPQRVIWKKGGMPVLPTNKRRKGRNRGWVGGGSFILSDCHLLVKQEIHVNECEASTNKYKTPCLEARCSIPMPRQKWNHS